MNNVPTGHTFHLVPSALWTNAADLEYYKPEAFDADGFVHCTDGLDNLLVPANRYYRGDQRPFLALELDLDKVSAPVRYDDEANLYPHIYGPVETVSVVATYAAVREPDGTFTTFTPLAN